MAWNLAREQGIAALSLRDLARRLGMTAPSLYSYFESKHALFDAMFAQGYEEFLQLEWPHSDDLRDVLRRSGRIFLEFCTADPARYQLLFQRTIPGFAPSRESWDLAQRAYERSVVGLARLGLDEQRDLDLVTGVFSGLAAQQLANEPTGSRWARLVDEAADMLASHLHRRTTANQTSPDRTSPDRTSPGRTSPDQTNAERTSPGRTSPGRTSPDQTTRSQPKNRR